MPERPKPPLEKSSRSGSRHEAATMQADSPGFSIETTTMRLKSLKLRRAEAADQQISDAIKPWTPKDAPLWFALTATLFFLLLCCLFLRFLEKRGLYLRL